MDNRFSLAGKTAIVTGGSTGLGAGMAVGLAEAGADIVLVDLPDVLRPPNKFKQLEERSSILSPTFPQ